MAMPARMFFLPLPLFSGTDLTCHAVSNVTQRMRLHPNTDGLDWTSSAIFSRSGITRREGSHVRTHPLHSVFLCHPVVRLTFSFPP